MAVETIRINRDEYLFQIAARTEQLLRDMMATDDSITSIDEAIGRYSMILAAANNLNDMDYIREGDDLIIPPRDVVLNPRVLEATRDTNDAATHLQVYVEVERDYRNGGKERIQTALEAEPERAAEREIERTTEEIPTTAAPTVNAADAQTVVDAAGSYYIAIAGYDQIMEGLSDQDRADAARLLSDPNNLAERVAGRFPNNPELLAVAERVDAASTSLQTVLRSDPGLGTAGITETDITRTMNMLRIKAIQDQRPGNDTLDISIESTRGAVASALRNGGMRDDLIMAAATNNTQLEAALREAEGMRAQVATQLGQNNGMEFRYERNGPGRFDYEDLAELPQNGTNYDFDRGRVNLAVDADQGPADAIGRLRSDVRAALQANGVENPTDKQVTQATAFILSVENGEDRRTDRVDEGRISVPSTEEANAAVAVFASAMSAAEGAKLSRGEQRDALEEVQAALTPGMVADGSNIQR